MITDEIIHIIGGGIGLLVAGYLTVKYRAHRVEKRMFDNDYVEVGQEAFWVVSETNGVRYMDDCYVYSIAGTQIEFRDDAGGALRLTNNQYDDVRVKWKRGCQRSVE